MKILLLVAEHGYSFVIQAQALAKGLTQIGVNNKISKITNSSVSKRELKKYSPDIIISIGSWHSFQSLVIEPKLLGYRVVPWLVTDDKKSNRVSKYIDKFNQLNLLLTPSQICKNAFIKGGVKENIIKVLPEAVDCDFWKPIAQKEITSLSNLLSIPSSFLTLPVEFNPTLARKKNVPILFTMGGIATTKGAQEVISALSKVSDKAKKQKWIYIIKTWPSTESMTYSKKELELATRLKIHGIHYLTGIFSDVFIRGIMNICDIYVSPSRLEGFGLPLIEAQLCEKPIISLKNTATAETIIEGKTGFAVKSEIKNGQIRANIDSLAKKIDILLSNKELRQNMGKNGRIHAIRNFSPKIIAKKMLEIIK